MAKEKNTKKPNNAKKTNEKQPKNDKVFLYLIFLVLLALLAVVLKPYFGIIVVSYIYCLLTFPIFAKLNTRLPKWLSIIFTLLTSLLIILTPIIVLVTISVSEISELAATLPTNFDTTTIGTMITDLEKSIEETLSSVTGIVVDIDFEAIITALLEALGDALRDGLKSLGGSIVGMFVSAILLFFLVLYMLPNIESSSKSVTALLPINKDLAENYVWRTNMLIRDSFKAAILTAIAQGTLGGMLLAIVGVPYTLFWTLLMMIFSALPIVGTSFVMVPLAIIYMLNGEFVIGLIILLWQMIVVGTIDNLLRPKLISKENQLSEVALLITILGGIAVFGMMGIFYGPIIYMLTITTVKVIKEESALE